MYICLFIFTICVERTSIRVANPTRPRLAQRPRSHMVRVNRLFIYISIYRCSYIYLYL